MRLWIWAWSQTFATSIKLTNEILKMLILLRSTIIFASLFFTVDNEDTIALIRWYSSKSRFCFWKVVIKGVARSIYVEAVDKIWWTNIFEKHAKDSARMKNKLNKKSQWSKVALIKREINVWSLCTFNIKRLNNNRQRSIIDNLKKKMKW